MSPGKQIRMNSIFRKSTGNSVTVVFNHGGIAGPIKGIENPARVVRSCVQGGSDAILAPRGFVKAAIAELDRSISLILRLSGGFTVLGGKFEEQIISSPEAALMYGADGAAATVKFGHVREAEFTRQASLLADSCERWAMPLMIEALVNGKNLNSTDPRCVKLAARAAQEIGADIVKTCYTGSPESFREVVEGCPAPILVLGGEKRDSLEAVFKDVYYAMQAGARGIAIGRNIWQHENVRAVVEAMVGLVHEGWSVNQALNHLRR
ncbi:3-hydroxy-5-phosphonooxypentane-2,4-dione thiolase [subsurface metagenome]